MKRRLFILTVSTISCSLFFYLFFSDRFSFREFVLSLTISFLYAFPIGFGNFALTKMLDKYCPWQENTGKRTIISIITTIFFNIICVYTISYLNFVTIQKDMNTGEYFHSRNVVVFNIICVLIAIIISLFMHASTFMKELIKVSKKEILAQKTIATTANAQFEYLKNQMDPHFLFNSLNVLSALIEENASAAIDFTNELSYVYRYVLTAQSVNLVKLADEIHFLQGYESLLKYRFGKAINIHFNINSATLQREIIPLSLQTTIENAVKHNITTVDQPLNIDIYTDGEYINVVNNKHPKPVLSQNKLGIGLSNLKQRYQLILNKDVIVIDEIGTFIVKLPLIMNSK